MDIHSKYDINDYLNINLDDYKSYLYRKKIDYENKISMINIKLKEANVLISKKCIKINGSHEWITERDPGVYGEKCTFCKKCNVHIYDNEHIL
jgi:hypothetical protein